MRKSLRIIAAGFAILGTLALLQWAPAPLSRADENSDSAQAAQNAQKPDDFYKSRFTRDEEEAKADKRKLLLTTGEDKPVDIDFDVGGANAIAVGNPKIVATTLVKIGEKRQIVFKPLGAGETNVTVRDMNGDIKLIFTVRVAASNLLTIAGELRDLLRDVEGVDVRVVGSKVVVDGELITPNDYGRLATVVGDKAYASYVINLAQLSNHAMVAIAQRIRQDVNSFAPNVTTRVVNGVVFLEGTVDTIDQARRAQKVAEIYLPPVRPNTLVENLKDTQAIKGRPLVMDFIVVNPPPPKKQDKLVRITAHFVELSKDYNDVFGFSWEPGFSTAPQITVGASTTGGAAASGSSFTGTISNLFPHLQSAQEAGFARILKSETVIVRSGQPALITEQTAYPINALGAQGQVNAGSTNVGVNLGVTPQILGQSEDISLDLKIDQTNVVGRDPASGTVPITTEHKVETKIYVKSNESAAIAGVTSSNVATDFNKDNPQAGNFAAGTDPLFTLLHSKNFSKKKGQFVVFITPQIIDDAAQGTDDLRKNFRIRVK